MNKIFKTLNVSLYTKVTRQHLSNISKGIDELNSKYDNILTIGDLNSDMSASPLDESCETYGLKSSVDQLVSKILKILHVLTWYRKINEKGSGKAKPLKLGCLTFIKWVFVFKIIFEKPLKEVKCCDCKRFENEKSDKVS